MSSYCWSTNLHSESKILQILILVSSFLPSVSSVISVSTVSSLTPASSSSTTSPASSSPPTTTTSSSPTVLSLLPGRHLRGRGFNLRRTSSSVWYSSHEDLWTRKQLLCEEQHNECLLLIKYVLVYLVDSTNSLLPAGPAAGLHHVTDVLSGSQQPGHVHCGLWSQRVPLRLIGSCHNVHLHLQNKKTMTLFVNLFLSPEISSET